MIFRGICKEYENSHIPVWTDYKSIKINGNEVLSHPISVWHDNPYTYQLPVKNGQEVTLEIEQEFHPYMEDELRRLLLKMNSSSVYVKDNIDDIMLYFTYRKW